MSGAAFESGLRRVILRLEKVENYVEANIEANILY